MSSSPRVALVTGAGSGIGRHAALALLADGYRVALAGRRRELLERTAADAGAASGRALVVPTDVSDPEAVAALFSQSQQAFGRLDVLFNNAGLGAPPVPLEDVTYQQWKAVVDVNLTGMFLCTQEAFRIMKRAGPAGRPHHQQRVHLRAHPATELRALHGHQTRGHRPDQIDRAGRPAVRHRSAARSTSATPSHPSPSGCQAGCRRQTAR